MKKAVEQIVPFKRAEDGKHMRKRAQVSYKLNRLSEREKCGGECWRGKDKSNSFWR